MPNGRINFKKNMSITDDELELNEWTTIVHVENDTTDGNTMMPLFA
jgi:hypothetical protein